jgi:hypothetical protein
VTFSWKVTSPTRVNVNVPVAGPISDALGSVASIVTTGAALSAIVTVAVPGTPTS